MKCVTHGTVDFLPGLLYVILPLAIIQLRLTGSPSESAT
jgi:hypothetical protein